MAVVSGRTAGLGFTAMVLMIAGCGDEVSQGTVSVPRSLCEPIFTACVQPILSAQITRKGGALVSCMDSNCHVAGGNGGRFTLGSNPSANMQVIANSFVDFGNAADSLILVEPTDDTFAPSATAAFHGGGEIFNPPRAGGDACYNAILNWINSDAVVTPACPCTPVANPLVECGY